MSRIRFTPEVGKTYLNFNGQTYRCLNVYPEIHVAMMQNTASGWTFNAHEIYQNSDGSVEWWYSDEGYFADLRKEA